MTLEVECLVVGGGVVGLAVGRALQRSGSQCFVIDREQSFGMGTSSRNSEVIHAGIYYPAGSAKARHCVEGKHLLYAYCEERGLPHRRIGKLIVATTLAEEAVLETYIAKAVANDVLDLQPKTKVDIRQLEPAVQGVAALLSPSTGIIDSHSYMVSLIGDLEDAGGHLVCNTALERATVMRDGFQVRLSDGSDIRCRWLINSAGLDAPSVARQIDGYDDARAPQGHLAIGHYYALSGKAPFHRLIYPIAPAGGLGVHVTLDLAGAAKFGPDVTWIDSIDYRFDDRRRESFIEAIRRYYPGLDPQRLVPGYTGIRPKIVPQGAPDGDFVVQGPDDHGISGLVHLFGIESPGLTSSLSIANEVAKIVHSNI